jgi:hypothetical protein
MEAVIEVGSDSGEEADQAFEAVELIAGDPQSLREAGKVDLFQDRIEAVLKGDQVACWSLVWQILVGTEDLSSENLLYLYRGLSTADFIDIDNAKIILATLKFVGKGGTPGTFHEAIRLLSSVNNWTPQAWSVYTMMYLYGAAPQDAKDFEELAGYYKELSNSVEAWFRKKDPERQMNRESIEKYENALEHPNPPLSPEGVAQLGRAFGERDILSRLADKYADDFGVLYQKLQYYDKHFDIAIRGPVDWIYEREQLAKKHPSKYINRLLRDQLLTVEEVKQFLDRLHLEVSIQNGTSGLNDHELELLANFYISWGMYQAHADMRSKSYSLQRYSEIDTAFSSVLTAIINHFHRNNAQLAESLEKRVVKVQVTVLLSDSVGDQAEFAWVCRKLWPVPAYIHNPEVNKSLLRDNILCSLPKTYHRHFSKKFTQYLKEQDLSEVFSETAKAELLALNSRDRHLPHLELYIAYCEQCGRDSVIASTKHRLNSSSPADDNANVRDTKVELLTFEQYCNKQPLCNLLMNLDTLHQLSSAENNVAQRSLLAKLSSFGQENHAAKIGNSKRFAQLIVHCQSAKPHTRLSWCMRQILAFLRHDNTLLGAHTHAEHLMQALSQFAKIKLADLVTTDRSTLVQIRNDFCSHLESRYCPSSLNTSVYTESSRRSETNSTLKK